MSICHMGCVGYADDLDRFIDGEISFDEIQSFRLQQRIMSSLQNSLTLYSKMEYDLYEKLCYAEVLRSMKFDYGAELYAIYLFGKNKRSPQKLDWDRLLEIIKRESGSDNLDIIEWTDMYEECQRNGGYYSDLLNSFPSYRYSYSYED